MNLVNESIIILAMAHAPAALTRREFVEDVLVLHVQLHLRSHHFRLSIYFLVRARKLTGRFLYWSLLLVSCCHIRARIFFRVLLLHPDSCSGDLLISLLFWSNVNVVKLYILKKIKYLLSNFFLDFFVLVFDLLLQINLP